MRGECVGNAWGMRGSNAWAAWLVGAGGWRLMGGGGWWDGRPVPAPAPRARRSPCCCPVSCPRSHIAMAVLRIDNNPVVLRVANNPVMHMQQVSFNAPPRPNVVHRMPPHHFETSESLAAPCRPCGHSTRGVRNFFVTTGQYQRYGDPTTEKSAHPTRRDASHCTPTRGRPFRPHFTYLFRLALTRSRCPQLPT
jgi:hypothetical protein